jgi:hypothetical protein
MAESTLGVDVPVVGRETEVLAHMETLSLFV